jgi:two-component system LytT family response regulator
MTTIQAILVDDEELARTLLREYLAEYPDVEIAAECANGFDAVRNIIELKPDLVFLDIQMPKLSGFEVLELIPHDLAVVFVTAYDQYALQAFNVHAVDYLLKPFTKERFAETMRLVRQRLQGRDSKVLDQLVHSVRQREKPLQRVLIRNGSQVHVIPVDQIEYVEAQDDYVAFVTKGKKHLKQQRLSEVEEQLDNARFVRIHRSYILNLDYLARIELYAKDSRMAILKDGTQLQVSRSGYEKLKARL